MDLAEFSGVSWSEVERVRREKLREKGGFTRFRVMLWDGREV